MILHDLSFFHECRKFVIIFHVIIVISHCFHVVWSFFRVCMLFHHVPSCFIVSQNVESLFMIFHYFHHVSMSFIFR